VEAEASRTVGAVISQGQEADEYNDNDGDESNLELLHIGDLSKRLIATVGVKSTPRQAAQVEIQDAPQAKTFQSKG
jgi:hypothetical protein